MFGAAYRAWQGLAGHAASSANINNDGSDGDDTSSGDGRSEGSDAESLGSSNYASSVADVLVTKALLQRAGQLPLELVDAIVDMAEYWPHTSTEIDFASRRDGAFILRARHARSPPEVAEDVMLVGLR